MREILFRGKSKDGDYTYGHWVYGNLTNFYAYSCDRKCYEIEEVYENSRNPPSHLVDEETVGQYTGLIDSNNKKIFEGDILKVGDNRIYKVEHKDNDAMFALLDEDAVYWHFHIAIAEEEKSEVIGNIYDNPELFKERAK